MTDLSRYGNFRECHEQRDPPKRERFTTFSIVGTVGCGCFTRPSDYAAFEQVLGEGLERYPSDLLTYCVMPTTGIWWSAQNRRGVGALMGWVGVTHVRRHTGTTTSRWWAPVQGRFKSFPVARDEYCWPSAGTSKRIRSVPNSWTRRAMAMGRPRAARSPPRRVGVSPWPVDRPAGWIELVNGGLMQNSSRVGGNAFRWASVWCGGLGAGSGRPTGPRFHPPRPWPP